MANVEQLKSAIGKSMPGNPMRPGVVKTPKSGSAIRIKPVVMPTQKAPSISSPYTKPLMQSPSGATNPGTFFQRPKPVAPTGAVSSEKNNIGNYRSLGSATGQSGPSTLPNLGQKLLSKSSGVETGSASNSLTKKILNEKVRESIPGATPKPISSFPNGPQQVSSGKAQFTQ